MNNLGIGIVHEAGITNVSQTYHKRITRSLQLFGTKVNSLFAAAVVLGGLFAVQGSTHSLSWPPYEAAA